MPENEAALIALCLALIGGDAALSTPERAIASGIRPAPDTNRIAELRAGIVAGEDPLGEAFLRLRGPALRRGSGATYTPPAIVAAMVDWAEREAGDIARVVDPGAGSGRFLLAAAKRFPRAERIGIERDPLAVLLLRANLAAAGLAHRARPLAGDYRDAALPEIEGRTLFIGNPPYLRHHGIEAHWKNWFAETARGYGVKASRLAGLHLHFFLRTLQLARPGDLGCFVTAAEWLDVNYGSALRELLAGALGGVSIHALDPKSLPFEGVMTTGVIAGFRVGGNGDAIRLRHVASAAELDGLSGGIPVPRTELAAAPRWSVFLRAGPAVPGGGTELGEICRVHRGQVTGGNRVWIESGESGLPARFLFPAVTKARELIAARDALVDGEGLRRIIDLPVALDGLAAAERRAVDRFLDWARRQGAERSYVAQHRKAWWAVGLREPAPILCTYMARRPPAFVRNLCGARHINIAHGLYPREPMAGTMLDALAAWLRGNVAQSGGRTYAGGLTKFEPKEIERIVLPRWEDLMAASA